jgi:hypothetical protein
MLEGIKIFFKKSWGTIAAIAAGVAALIGFFLVRKRYFETVDRELIKILV